MDLKNAVAVCLISLFSATLVVLIARALESQTASRLEPQLASIVEELRELRKQGGMVAASPASGHPKAETGDALVVYYFHSNTRCPTCQSIESQARDAVKSEFAPQLSSGEIAWKVLNYEQPAAATLKKKFDVQVPVVVLARTRGGEIGDWKRLDEVWALESDHAGFKKFVRDEVQAMLTPAKEPQKESASALPSGDIVLFPRRKTDAPSAPAPKAESSKSDDAKKISDLPIP